MAGLSRPKRLGCTAQERGSLQDPLIPTDGQALLIKGIPAEIRDRCPILDGGHGGVRESPWLRELQETRKEAIC